MVHVVVGANFCTGKLAKLVSAKFSQYPYSVQGIALRDKKPIDIVEPIGHISWPANYCEKERNLKYEVLQITSQLALR